MAGKETVEWNRVLDIEFVVLTQADDRVSSQSVLLVHSWTPLRVREDVDLSNLVEPTEHHASVDRHWSSVVGIFQALESGQPHLIFVGHRPILIVTFLAEYVMLADLSFDLLDSVWEFVDDTGHLDGGIILGTSKVARGEILLDELSTTERWSHVGAGIADSAICAIGRVIITLLVARSRHFRKRLAGLENSSKRIPEIVCFNDDNSMQNVSNC